MLLALLGDFYDLSVDDANFRYYEPRTGHGSSLSPPVHALVAARMGEAELAKRYFDETAAIDLDDTMGNTAGGVHIGAQGGLWQAAVFGFGGVRPTGSALKFDPHLPEGWRKLSFPLQWRGRLLQVCAEHYPRRLTLSLERGRPMQVYVGQLPARLERGMTMSFLRTDGGWEEGGTHGA
jgi:kojibiose phosphorylase